MQRWHVDELRDALTGARRPGTNRGPRLGQAREIVDSFGEAFMPGWNGIIVASTLSLAMLAFTASGASAQHAEPPQAQFSRIAHEATNADDRDGEDEDQWWPGHARMAAGLASTIVPGGGQFFKGEHGKGALMLTGFAAAIAYAFAAGFSDQEICVGPSTQPHCTVATNQMNSRFLIGLGTAAGIQAWSIVDAFSPRRR